MQRMRRTTKYVARNTPSASVIVRSLQSREKPCVFRQGPARRAQCSQEVGACQKLMTPRAAVRWSGPAAAGSYGFEYSGIAEGPGLGAGAGRPPDEPRSALTQEPEKRARCRARFH